jgi:hypothetical protein
MIVQNVIMELEAIESVRDELKKAVDNRQAYEILGRLVSLYSALNVVELRKYLELEIDSLKEAA